MREGDYYFWEQDGQYHPGKVLRIDSEPDGSQCYHVTSFQPMDRLPTAMDIDGLQRFAWHLPMSGEATEEEGTVFGHRPVVHEELYGFHYYLRETDWQRYGDEVRKNPDPFIETAQKNYERGCALSKNELFEEAIEEYQAAFSQYPFFYEALDNWGFDLLELNRIDEAIDCFRSSLQGDENNPLAFFMIGKCIMLKGDLDGAARIFEEGEKKWPGHPDFPKFLELVNVKRRTAGPWWKFW